MNRPRFLARFAASFYMKWRYQFRIVFKVTNWFFDVHVSPGDTWLQFSQCPRVTDANIQLESRIASYSSSQLHYMFFHLFFYFCAHFTSFCLCLRKSICSALIHSLETSIRIWLPVTKSSVLASLRRTRAQKHRRRMSILITVYHD